MMIRGAHGCRFDVTQRYGTYIPRLPSERNSWEGEKEVINKGGDYGGRDTDCETEIAIERSR